MNARSVSLDQTLAALADPQRRAVIDLLRVGPRRAGDLAAALALAPPTMSRHLKTLRVCGLVEEQADDFDARVRIYRLRPQAMADVKLWLAETERLWTLHSSAFEAHLAPEAAA